MFVYNKLIEKLNDARISEYVLQNYYYFSRSVILNIKNMHAISLESLEKFAKIFDCSITDLFEYVDVDDRLDASIIRARERIAECYRPRGTFKKWELQDVGKVKKRRSAALERDRE